ncbi:hypothetical protein GCM10027610_044580 [Dactylosporangium cerinum]
MPAGRRAVTRLALGVSVVDEFLFDGLEWWELIDPADGDEQPAAALAAVRPGRTSSVWSVSSRRADAPTSPFRC